MSGDLVAVQNTTSANASLNPPGVTRRLWCYRAPLAGLAVIVLAILGEQLSRGPAGTTAPNPAIGMDMLRVAVALVGLVAWVRIGARLPRSGPPSEAGVLVRRPTPPPLQAVPIPDRQQTWAGRALALPTAIDHLRDLRARLGWGGTALGLLAVTGLAVWCYLLLRQDFRDPLAPWVWLAALVALVLTFVGMRPSPIASLVPNDPTEPVTEPPLTRGEWLAIGAIMLVAIAVRLWNLESIPIGPYTDEGDRANEGRHVIRGELVNQEPFALFGAGWWGVPNLYFWLVGQSIHLFGNTLAGARMVHALAGIGTVWFTYRIGRVVWSPRVGLLAAALLAVSDFAIQFSRTAGESTITMFTWTVCFYYLYRALRTRRPLDFVWSGLAAGFTLYGYVSGKLLPVFMALIALYLLGRWGLRGARRYLPGLVLLALAAGLTYAPNGLYTLAHTDAFTMRYNGVAIFNHASDYQAAYHTDSWPVIIARQFMLTYAAFDVGQERGPFYPTNQPILPVAWAALWVLGTAYLIWRAGDVRFAVLGLWILSGLAGAALTNDTPTLQRVAGMVPTLALVPAVFLDRVRRGIPAMGLGLPRPRRTLVLRRATSGLFVVLILTLAIQTLYFYFVPYTAAANYEWFGMPGRYAQTLDPQHNVMYLMDYPELTWDSPSMSPSRFLAGDLPGSDLINPADDLPLTTNGTKNAHFLVYPSEAAYLPVLQTYYPGGKQTPVLGSTGHPYFTAYAVDAHELTSLRQTTAHYVPATGLAVTRQEPQLGTAGADAAAPVLPPPAALAYPARAEWIAGVVVPAYGTYRLALTAPGGGTLEIDGRPVLTAEVQSAVAVEAPVVLAKGVHQVRLAGTLLNGGVGVELRWGTNQGILVPVGQRFLWNGPQGSLLGQSYSGPDSGKSLTGDLPSDQALPLTARRDGVLGWRSMNAVLKRGPGTVGVWQGTLMISAAGTYVFDAATAAPVTLWVDGRLAGAANIPGTARSLPVSLTLPVGNHDFEVRFQARTDDSALEVFWTPPNQQQQILSPAAFLPARGGVWMAAERPGVAAPDPALIDAIPPVLPVGVVAQVSGDWKEARGVAVLPDGSVVVGDTGHQRLLVYAPDHRQAAAWGSAGSADGQFGTISDVAVRSDGTIAVLDSSNDDIQLFDSHGKEIAHWCRDMVQIGDSGGLTWGPDGKIYVADTARSRIVRLGTAGRPEASFRDGGAQHQALNQPIDVVVTADGTIYAVDLLGRVVRFSHQGLIDREWVIPVGAGRGGSHMTLWGRSLVITDPDGNSIATIDLDTGISHAVQVVGSAPLELVLPVGVAVGPANRLYVLDSDHNRVLVFESR
ncbi:MAG: glycosyltransferase family 39 protein [Chloroflexia bacterium]